MSSLSAAWCAPGVGCEHCASGRTSSTPGFIHPHTRRLEKYALRGFRVGVPGLQPGEISAALLRGHYVFIAEKDLLLQTTPLSPHKASMQLCYKQRCGSVAAGRMDAAKVVTGYKRLVCFGDARVQVFRAGIPKTTFCEQHRKLSERSVEGKCLPLPVDRTGTDFLLLWDVSSGPREEEEEEDECYTATPLAAVLKICEQKLDETIICSGDEGAVRKISARIQSRMAKRQVSGAMRVVDEALDASVDNRSPLIFVYSFCSLASGLNALKGVLDATTLCGLPTLSEEEFQERYGLPRTLAFQKARDRRIAGADVWSELY